MTGAKYIARFTSTGRLLTKARLAKHLSGEQVADRIGVTRTQYVNMESGRSSTVAHRLWSLCRVLGIDAAALLRALERDGESK